jgi:hypothetical protein
MTTEKVIVTQDRAEQSATNESAYTRFVASVVAEGPYSSEAQVFTPASLLELALGHALFSMPAEVVADQVRNTTARMLHSLSCKRREPGELVRLEDENPDGYNGVYKIAVGRGEPTDCVSCGNPLCIEWPTLVEVSPDGKQTGDFAYHISECQMLDAQTDQPADV